MSTHTSFCTFRVGRMTLGVDVLRVQEVIRQQAITSVPLSPEAVSGLMNLRGQIVTALDLGRCLDVTDDEDVPLMNVVIRTVDDTVSLRVHEIGDVVVVDPEQLELPPDTLQAAARSLISSVCRMEDGLLLILDTDAVLAAAA